MATIEWHVVVLALAVPFVITFLLVPRQVTFMKRIGWMGHDIHKHDRPPVAESGGISVLAGLASGLVLAWILVPSMTDEILAVLASVGCAAAIGLVDDKLRLSAYKKIASVVIAAIPMTLLYLAGGGIFGAPPVPFLGHLQVTILYLPFIPGFLAVMMNVVNMLEGYNGEGAGTSIVVAASLLAGSLIMGATSATVLVLPLLGALAAFFWYNRYPARIFPGDIGTLQVGMMLGCVAIIGNLEFALIVAVIPHVFNAFHVIRSVRGFKESKSIAKKDIELVEGTPDLVKGSKDPEASLTIPRILTAKVPLSEPALVKHVIVLNLVPAMLSIFSVLLIRLTVDPAFDVAWIIACLAIVALVFIAVILKFPACKWLTIVFTIVYAGALVMLAFIAAFVVGLGFFNWLVAGALALAGFGAWYVLSMKYFTRLTT